MSDVLMKRCSRGDDCVHPEGPLLPAITEYFYRDIDKADNLSTQCRECKKAYRRKVRKQNLEKKVLGEPDDKRPEKYKTCRLGTNCDDPDGPLLSLTGSYFHKARSNKDGYKNLCRVCANLLDWRRKNPNSDYNRHREEYLHSVVMQRKGFQKCSKSDQCVHPDGPWLPLTQDYFNVQLGKKSGFRSDCKECQKITKARWASNNQEHIKAYTLANRDRQRAYYQENRDHFLKLARERWHTRKDELNAARREWRRNNPEKAREMDRKSRERKLKNNYTKYRKISRRSLRRYRARKKNLPDTMTHEQTERMLDYFGNQCVYCGKEPDLFTQLDMDHFVPLDDPDCPGTVATNLIPACSSKQALDGHVGCNQSKSNKDPEAWLIDRFGKRKAKRILKRIHAYFAWVQEQDP